MPVCANAYEAGAATLPLCETAVTTVAVPVVFRYWLQGGRITIGFLGAAQLDKFGNMNATVIGDYAHPKTRLLGGGAPKIATSSKQVYIAMAKSKRGMVETIDFFTSFGRGEGGDHRKRLGIDTAGPTLLLTDLAVWKPDPVAKEFTVMSLHPHVTREEVQAASGWVVWFSEVLNETPAPTEIKLKTLRDLQARTKAAYQGTAKGKAA